MLLICATISQGLKKEPDCEQQIPTNLFVISSGLLPLPGEAICMNWARHIDVVVAADASAAKMMVEGRVRGRGACKLVHFEKYTMSAGARQCMTAKL